MLLFSPSGMAQDDEEWADRQIAEARQLSNSAPWPQSEAILEDLLDQSERLTVEQRTRILLMQARNRAIAENYQEALDILRTLLDQNLSTPHRLRALELAANVAAHESQFEQAFEYLNRAVKLIPEVEDQDQYSGLFSLLAFLHTLIGNHDKALDFGQEAVDMARRAAQPHNECYALQRYGWSQELAGRRDQAEATYRTGLEFCSSQRETLVVAVLEISLGRLHTQQGSLDEAQRWLEQGYAHAIEAGYRPTIVDSRFELARLRLAQNRMAEARELARSVISPLAESDAWEEVGQAYEMLATIAETENKPGLALGHYRASMAAREKFLDRARGRRLAYLEVEFDTLRHEHENELLRQRNLVLELEREGRQDQMLIVIGGAGAAAIIGGLLLLLLFRSLAESRRLRRTSQRDSLTGLFNHTQFFVLIKQALQTSVRKNHSFTLIMADIDHFKQVNDEFGHMVGDAVLQRTAEHFTEAFGEAGIIGRIGGEEFGIGLPDCDAAQAQRLIATFQRALQTDKHMVTVSFGLVETTTAQSVQALRRRADAALYWAKKEGRDRAVQDREMPHDAASAFSS